VNLRRIVREGADRIYLAQERDKWQVLVNTVMNLRLPQKRGLLRFSRRTMFHRGI